MYKFSYEDVLEEQLDEARKRERMAFEHSIELMRKAEAAGVSSIEAVEAVTFGARLWTVLLEDLASPDNDLPEQLKSQIISIGIWMLKELEKLRRQEANSFSGLIVVSETFCEGLK